jgi:hypothetical protein
MLVLRLFLRLSYPGNDPMTRHPMPRLHLTLQEYNSLRREVEQNKGSHLTRDETEMLRVFAIFITLGLASREALIYGMTQPLQKDN